MTGALPKPQIVRREKGKYAVINVSLKEYDRVQRVGLAMLAWDQMVTWMEKDGESTANVISVATRLSEVFDCSRNAIRTARYSMNRNGDEHLPGLISGELDLATFYRRSGMKKKYYVKHGVTHAADGVTYYGKGDPFNEVMEPIRRYLRAWKKRGFEYRHLAPREAKTRLVVVRELIANLQEAEKDLERRSHLATLRAPSERKERNK